MMMLSDFVLNNHISLCLEKERQKRIEKYIEEIDA